MGLGEKSENNLPITESFIPTGNVSVDPYDGISAGLGWRRSSAGRVTPHEKRGGVGGVILQRSSSFVSSARAQFTVGIDDVIDILYQCLKD